MSKRLCWVAALLGAVVVPAWAQEAKPASAAATSEASAAMERAKRLAASPMRVIMQAGKMRRKANEADAAPVPVDAVNLRRAVATTSATTSASPVASTSTSTSASTSASTPTSPPAPSATSPVAGGPAPSPATTPTTTATPTAVAPGTPAVAARETAAEPSSAITTTLVLEAPQLSAPATQSVTGLGKTAAPVVMPASLAKMVLPEALAGTLPSAQPKLLSTVEPDIPKRLRLDTGRVDEVQADLNLRPDGTVAQVHLIGPYPRSWGSYIVAAMEKWRFEPLASARVHRVQLVFSEQ